MFADLRNLGPASASMLVGAGIESLEQLRALGAVGAFVAVRRSGASPSLNLLWALAGALSDRRWQDVSREDRMMLLMQLDDCERVHYTDW